MFRYSTPYFGGFPAWSPLDCYVVSIHECLPDDTKARHSWVTLTLDSWLEHIYISYMTGARPLAQHLNHRSAFLRTYLPADLPDFCLSAAYHVPACCSACLSALPTSLLFCLSVCLTYQPVDLLVCLPYHVPACWSACLSASLKIPV